MILNAVYRNNHLIALFPTRAAAEKHIMPKTWEEADNLVSMAVDTGLRYNIKDMKIIINPRAKRSK